MLHPATQRYTQGSYDTHFGDDAWKAAQMRQIITHIPDKTSIRSYADVGAGYGGMFVELVRELREAGLPVTESVAYDVGAFDEALVGAHPDLAFRHEDFLAGAEQFDLVTLNDVVEHVPSPEKFLSVVARRARYVALHIPLDDRLSVLLTNQFNYRLETVGHISFWSPASALTMLTSSGLVPLKCRYTGGFLAPSGRVRIIQRVALPFRWLLWTISPGLAAITTGGASLAVLCRGQVE
jgi:hypothetical protein